MLFRQKGTFYLNFLSKMYTIKINLIFKSCKNNITCFYSITVHSPSGLSTAKFPVIAKLPTIAVSSETEKEKKANEGILYICIIWKLRVLQIQYTINCVQISTHFFQLDMIHQASSPIVQNSKKFVRQEALETDEVSTSTGSDRINCEVKDTSDDHEEIQDINVNNDRTFERNWSTTSQHTTESGSEDNFSLLPDSDLSRSSEASSDKESFAYEIHHESEHEEFSVNQVELGRLK